MPDAFKPGDVVRLKSGGPAMTVTKLNPAGIENGATCQWFNDKAKLKTGMFAQDALTPVRHHLTAVAPPGAGRRRRVARGQIGQQRLRAGIRDPALSTLRATSVADVGRPRLATATLFLRS